MCVTLAAKADDRNNAVLDDGKVCVVVVHQISHGFTPYSLGSGRVSGTHLHPKFGLGGAVQ
jgi:hypothetical protein